MALTRTHKNTISKDGELMYFRDTTPIEDYELEGINPCENVYYVKVEVYFFGEEIDSETFSATIDNLCSMRNGMGFSFDTSNFPDMGPRWQSGDYHIILTYVFNNGSSYSSTYDFSYEDNLTGRTQSASLINDNSFYIKDETSPDLYSQYGFSIEDAYGATIRINKISSSNIYENEHATEFAIDMTSDVGAIESIINNEIDTYANSAILVSSSIYFDTEYISDNKSLLLYNTSGFNHSTSGIYNTSNITLFNNIDVLALEKSGIYLKDISEIYLILYHDKDYDCNTCSIVFTDGNIHDFLYNGYVNVDISQLDNNKVLGTDWDVVLNYKINNSTEYFSLSDLSIVNNIDIDRTHSVNVSIDKSSITIKDTTNILDYINAGIIPEQAESILFSIGKYGEQASEEIELVDYVDLLRGDLGFTLKAEDILDIDFFEDNLYYSNLTFIFDGISLQSSNYDFFYEDIKNKVAVMVIDTDWKVILDMNSRESQSKKNLKLKGMLDRLEYANDNNLVEEGLNILNYLKNI